MKDQMDKELPQIAEVIVVEGRDDTAAIKRAVRAVTIETHGFGISKSTWEKIECAYNDYGIIIFTDPDHAGEEIRRKLLEKFPDAKQAFLSREKAMEKKGMRKGVNEETVMDDGQKKEKMPQPDIGIENALPEDIREALKKAHANISPPRRTASDKHRSDIAAAEAEELTETCAETFTMSELDDAGLSGGDGAKQRREKLGDILGIGYANAKGLLYKLNTLGVDRKTFEDALKKL